ncbi:D-glycero-beta-D-manno-heptose 1-phosphate adenylyltransferase [Candidatus Latescibacterota bacterium]
MRQRLTAHLDAIASGSVLVVGDIILDLYIIGESERISPEAPEPIILEHERLAVPGGAANVAANIVSLNARARLFGAIGDDDDGNMVSHLIQNTGISHDGIMTIPGRLTTRKTRFIARGTQVLRVDRETTAPLDKQSESALIDALIACPEQVVIVSDYAKGVVFGRLVRELVGAGKKVLVDPKSTDLQKYEGAYLVTPNLGEFAHAAGTDDFSPANFESAALKLMKQHRIENILVTLGPDGMVLVEQENPLIHFHSRTREVFDVTGAGDTVIAAIGASVAGGATLSDSCLVANIAAGIVVGKHRTATTTPGEILSYAFGPSAADKIVDHDKLRARILELRRAGKKIVFTNGCFDLLHVGHITFLNEARGLGDALVVGLNTDLSVRTLKGPSRPILPEQERSHLLAALECVDYVVLFGEETPSKLISDIKPDILVKGADYSREKVVGHDIVESYGGQVHLIELVRDISTTTIINRIKGNG